MFRTRVVAVSVAALGLLVVACLATTAVAVGSAPEPPLARAALPPEPVRAPVPVTTPPAPAPSVLAEAARAALEAEPAPPCARTRELAPDGSRLRAKPVTSDDSRQGCPQSRDLRLQGAP
jgi:hypothetical protein